MNEAQHDRGTIGPSVSNGMETVSEATTTGTEASTTGTEASTTGSMGIGIEEEIWVKEIRPLHMKERTLEEISRETGYDEYLVQAIIERQTCSQVTSPGLSTSQPTVDGADGADGAMQEARLASTPAPLAPHAPGCEEKDGAGSQMGHSEEENRMLDTADMGLIASASLADVIDLEKLCIRLKDELDYIAVNIGLGLSYIQDLLPKSSRIFYIGFRGPRGSGKTTATAFCSRVAFRGRKLEGVTFASLAAACDEGETLCIDEFDAQSARCPELDAIVRQGIALDATYSKMVPDKEHGWRRHNLSIGGVKFLNWKDPIDDALLQRTAVVDMAPNASTRMIVNNEAMEHFTSPLAAWFAAQSAGVHKQWTEEQVAELVRDHDNHLTNKVDAIASVVPRQKQKAFWMLVVCEMFGWDFDETIARLIQRQPEAEDYSDYVELVAEIYLQKRELLNGRGDHGGSVVMELVDFKADLSERIAVKRLDPLRTRGRQGTLTWTGLRQECGFVEGVNERKVRGRGGKRHLYFDERVQRMLGVSDEQATLGDEPGGEE